MTKEHVYLILALQKSDRNDLVAIDPNADDIVSSDSEYKNIAQIFIRKIADRITQLEISKRSNSLVKHRCQEQIHEAEYAFTHALERILNDTPILDCFYTLSRTSNENEDDWGWLVVKATVTVKSGRVWYVINDEYNGAFDKRYGDGFYYR